MHRDFLNLFPNEFSVNYNAFTSPKTSSKNTWYLKFLALLIFALTLTAIFNFWKFAYYFALTTNLIFLANFAFKFFIFGKYLNLKPLKRKLKIPHKLPIYTILLPCYMEEESTLKTLISSISNLNYPQELLDVKFLLEEDDLKTILNLKQLKHNFEVLIIQRLNPKTKPKACNFGLYFASGEFLVVYDAEDRPERNQLLKALSAFSQGQHNLVCLQARLNFYNISKNILSKCFALEYLTWFNAYLPALTALNSFILLGGTSNHFKTNKLIEVGGWDAYNVTEDAELGLRIHNNGYKVEMIESYTFEEAPFKLEDWLFQRKRWMKGHLQTFFVHLFSFKKNFISFCAFFLFLGSGFFSFFLIPFTIFFASFIQASNLLFNLYLANLFCSIFYVLMFFIVAQKEGLFPFKSTPLIMPIYFLLHIIASFFAIYELFTKPFFWHKTKHNVKD